MSAQLHGGSKNIKSRMEKNQEKIKLNKNAEEISATNYAQLTNRRLIDCKFGESSVQKRIDLTCSSGK